MGVNVTWLSIPNFWGPFELKRKLRDVSGVCTAN